MTDMKEIRINNTVSTKVLTTLILILLALSGMAAIASADGATPIRFYGNATLNGDEPATAGMVINAYINGEFSAMYTIAVDGKYYIDVRGNESDEGELITFTIAGDRANQTDTWHASTNAETRLLDIWTGAPPTGASSGHDSSSTGDGASNEGGTSGGYALPAATPTATDAQPVSGEIVTSNSSVTPAETSTKKLAEKPETKGLLPGFEAVFVIAGLLAVAYLIRRR
jgi:PGF-CTERM protein